MSTHGVDNGAGDGQYQALQLRTNAKIVRYQARLELARGGLSDALRAARAEAGIESAEPLKTFSIPPPLPMIDQTRSSRPPEVPPSLAAATAKSSGWVAKISDSTGMPVVVPIAEDRLGRARKARG